MKKLVIESLPLIRPANHPPNEKMLDYLLTMTSVDSDQAALISKILDNYIERYEE